MWSTHLVEIRSNNYFTPFITIARNKYKRLSNKDITLITVIALGLLYIIRNSLKKEGIFFSDKEKKEIIQVIYGHIDSREKTPPKGVVIYSKDGDTNIISYNCHRGKIYKYGIELAPTSDGYTGDVNRRLVNIEKVRKLCKKHNLNKLIIPKVAEFSFTYKKKKYVIMVQEKLSGGMMDFFVSLFRTHLPKTALEQLALVICETEAGDCTKQNMFALGDKIALFDFQDFDGKKRFNGELHPQIIDKDKKTCIIKCFDILNSLGDFSPYEFKILIDGAKKYLNDNNL
ncbi:MAG: hypothetical protein SP4CHLAM5_05300 [Chlamydiia bacterium]|nr:hypothetical protein [Chlamydiia bacterium]MCH9618401.1 hypothetical protein [Chlamydiia bacterium]MCH9624281.1 hypothetical protein [Chlamydiia bacterium]